MLLATCRAEWLTGYKVSEVMGISCFVMKHPNDVHEMKEYTKRNKICEFSAACSSHAHHMLITCTSHAHHMHITCSSHAHHMLITCTSHAHHMLITCSSHAQCCVIACCISIAVFKEGYFFVTPYRIVTAWGQWIWLESKAYPIVGKNGEPAGIRFLCKIVGYAEACVIH